MEQFKDGDRVVFLGDSLIGGSRIATHIADCYRRLFPERRVHFFNCGAAGGESSFGLEIFDEDVLPCKPTHVVVAYGTNDSWRWCLNDRRHQGRYDLLKEKHHLFKENLTKLCQRVTDNGFKLILCTPTPYDEYQECDTPTLRGGYTLLSECANRVREIAKENGYTLCDYYTPMVEMMQEDTLFSNDRTHPTEHGGFCMAKIFLQAQGIDIGEEKPMPEYIKEWHTAVSSFRQIYTAECMLKLGADRPVTERLKKAQEIFENESTNDWFKSLAKYYLKNKPNQAIILSNLIETYEKTVLTKEY